MTKPEMQIVEMREALRQALDEEMESDAACFHYGGGSSRIQWRLQSDQRDARQMGSQTGHRYAHCRNGLCRTRHRRCHDGLSSCC